MRRTLQVILVLLFALLPGLALAQPVEVASGQDLSAWQALENRRLQGADAVAAYRGFVLTFHASPLAIAAWDRLVALDAATVEGSDPGDHRRLVSVRDHWEAHHAALLAAVRPAVVARIDLSGPDDDAAASVRDTGR